MNDTHRDIEKDQAKKFWSEQRNKRIKGISLHREDGTSETHLFLRPGAIPRASFFTHEGDFKDTVPTDAAPLEIPVVKHDDLAPADNPWVVRGIIAAILICAGVAAFFSRS